MAAVTTMAADWPWRPDVRGYPATQIIPGALINETSTVVGSVDGDEPAVRVPWVDDGDASVVAEGQPIPEADPALSEIIVRTSKVAQLLRLSREQYGQPGTAQAMLDSVRRAVTKAANTDFLGRPADAGTGPAGLLNLDGVGDGGTLGDNLDGLADSLATIEAEGGTPSHVIAAPDAWSTLRKLKTATGSNVGLLGAGTDDAERRVFNLPVLTTAGMPAGGLLVIDKTAIASVVGPVQVATSTDAYFASDSVAVRCTFRSGWNLTRPARAVKLTVGSE